MEYNEGIKKCADCGLKLYKNKSVKKVRKAEKAAEVTTDVLARVSNQIEADILMTALKKHGIECMMRQRTVYNGESIFPAAVRFVRAEYTPLNPHLIDGIILVNRDKKNKALDVIKVLRDSMGMN